MDKKLDGKRIAFLVTDGFEQVELTKPWKAVKEAGAKVELVSPSRGTVEGRHHFDPGDRFDVDRALSDCSVDDFDGLVLPGGVANPDALRLDEKAVAFARGFVEKGKPIAAICHGPWLLVEAGVVDGRTITSWPSLRTDIENAGGHWVDEEVHVDRGLVTSRKPDDLDAFCRKAVEEFGEGRH